MSSRTFSAMPPMSLAMIGRPWRNASWITTGEFSHQVEGTIVQSTSRIRVGRSGLLYEPMKRSRRPATRNSSLTAAWNSSGWSSRLPPKT